MAAYKATIGYALIGTGLFIATFCAAWYITFFVLYEYIYGDTSGGRWTWFVWPVAFVAAAGAVTMFLLHMTGYKRISLGVLAGSVLVMIVAAVAWILFAAAFLTPRPHWVPPPSVPAPQPQELEPEEAAHDATLERRGVPRQ